MKAVILAAGKGTRFVVDSQTGYLSEYLDKIMLPLGGKPIIEHILNELFTAGIRKFVLVVSSHSTKIPLQQFVQRWESVKKKADRETRIEFAYQPHMLGTADALLQARERLGETFAVFYGDDVWVADEPRAAQLLKAHKIFGHSPVISAMEVPAELATRLGVLKHVPIRGRLSVVEGIVEKPAMVQVLGSGPYLAAVSGMILTGEIFPFLERAIFGPRMISKPEIFLTEALDEFAKHRRLLALKLKGRWIDCGTWEDYLKMLCSWSQ